MRFHSGSSWLALQALVKLKVDTSGSSLLRSSKKSDSALKLWLAAATPPMLAKVRVPLVRCRLLLQSLGSRLNNMAELMLRGLDLL